MVVGRVPVPMTLNLVLRLILTLTYAIHRARNSIEVEFEDLLQSTFSLVALYTSPLVPMVYLTFYGREDFKSSKFAKWMVDDPFEFEKKNGESLCVIAIKAERESSEPQRSVNTKNSCPIEDTSRDGQCLVRTPIMLATVSKTECNLLKWPG